MYRPSPHEVVGFPPPPCRPSSIPASRLAFPARPGFRAGRKKVPYVAPPRAMGRESEGEWVNVRGDADIGADGGGRAEETAVKEMEPTKDAAVEFVKSMEKCLKDFYVFFGESDSEESDFSGFDDEEVDRSERDADDSYVKTLDDVTVEIDKQRRGELDEDEHYEESPSELPKGDRVQKNASRSHDHIPRTLGRDTSVRSSKQSKFSKRPSPALISTTSTKRRCSDRHACLDEQSASSDSRRSDRLAGATPVADRDDAPTSRKKRVSGANTMLDAKMSPTARTDFPPTTPVAPFRGRLKSRTTSVSSDSAPDSSEATPARTGDSAASTESPAPLSSPGTPLIVSGKRERKPSMKIKMIAADHTGRAAGEKMKKLGKMNECHGSGGHKAMTNGFKKLSTEESIFKPAGKRPKMEPVDENTLLGVAESAGPLPQTAEDPSEMSDVLDSINDLSSKFSEVVVGRLKSVLAANAYPNASERADLAAELGLQPKQVKNWFERQRKKLKKISPDLVLASSPQPHKPKSERRPSMSPPLKASTTDSNDFPDDDDDALGELKIDLDALPDEEGVDETYQSLLKLPSRPPPSPVGLSDNRILPSASASSPAVVKKKRGELFPRPALIKLWEMLIRHKDHPFPSLEEKQRVAKEAGLALNQVSKWVFFARQRKYLQMHDRIEGLENFIEKKYFRKASTTPNLRVRKSKSVPLPAMVEKRLRPESTSVLKTWLLYRKDSPIPSHDELSTIASKAEVPLHELETWFKMRYEDGWTGDFDVVRLSSFQDLDRKEEPAKRSVVKSKEQRVKKLRLRRAQGDVLRSWLYRNRAHPELTEDDFRELEAATSLNADEIQRWVDFAVKKGVPRRLTTVWKKKGEAFTDRFLPAKSVNILKRYLLRNPHVIQPNWEDKQKLWKKTGLTMKQIQIWFAKANQRDLRSRIFAQRAVSGIKRLEWEDEEDPPTEDESRSEIVVESGESKSKVTEISRRPVSIRSPRFCFSDDDVASISLTSTSSSSSSLIPASASRHLLLSLYRRRTHPFVDAREKLRLSRVTNLPPRRILRWFQEARAKKWARKLRLTLKDGVVVAAEEDGGVGDKTATKKKRDDVDEAIEDAISLIPTLRTAVAKLTPKSPDVSSDAGGVTADDVLEEDLDLSSSSCSSNRSNDALDKNDLAMLQNGSLTGALRTAMRTNGDHGGVGGEGGEAEDEEFVEEADDDNDDAFETDSPSLYPPPEYFHSVVPQTDGITEDQLVRLSMMLFNHRGEAFPDPSAKELEEASAETGLKEEFVRDWFEKCVSDGIHANMESVSNKNLRLPPRDLDRNSNRTAPLPVVPHRRARYPVHVTNALKTFLLERRVLFPTAADLLALTSTTGLSTKRLRNWFGQARSKHLLHQLIAEKWKPEDDDGGEGIAGGKDLSFVDDGGDSIGGNGDDAPFSPSSVDDKTTSRSKRVIKPAKRFIEEHEAMLSSAKAKRRDSTPSFVTEETGTNNNDKETRLTLEEIQERVLNLPNSLQVMFSFRQHDILCEWLHAHQRHPVPSESQRRQLSRSTSLPPSQVANWLTHARRRILADDGADGDAPPQASSPARDTALPGANLLVTQPSKQNCDVCESEWKLLGYASDEGAGATICESCKIFYQTAMSRGLVFECVDGGLGCGRVGKALLDCEACRLLSCQDVLRIKPRVRPPKTTATGRSFANGGGDAPSPRIGSNDVEASPQRKGPRIKYVCRKAALAQSQGVPALFPTNAASPSHPSLPTPPPRFNGDDAGVPTGSDADVNANQSVVRKGPRIKHVCRKAAVALGQGKPALFGQAGSILSPRMSLRDDDEEEEEEEEEDRAPMSPAGRGKGKNLYVASPVAGVEGSHYESLDAPDRGDATRADSTRSRDGASREKEFRLSALPVEEKERLYEAEKSLDPDPDDLPIEELIERAEAIATGSFVVDVALDGAPRHASGKGVGTGGKGKGASGGKGTGNRHGAGGLGKSSFSAGKDKERRRKVRCKVCKGCTSEDCDACVYCMDKPKNGGFNTIRQACVKRRCLNPQYSTAYD